MTTNINKSLSDIFDVELTTTDKSINELKIAAKADSIDTLETQRKYVKDNIITLLERGNVLLDNITNIANSSELSRDFLVAGDLIKTLVNTNMKLLDCEVAHKQKPDPATLTNTGQITNNNTSVFVGSTSELSRYLKESAIGVPSKIIND